MLGIKLYQPFAQAYAKVRALVPNAKLDVVKKPCAASHAQAIRDGAATEAHDCPAILDATLPGAATPLLEIQFVEDYPGAPGTMDAFRITEDQPVRTIDEAEGDIARANAKYGLPQIVTKRLDQTPSPSSTYQAFWCSPDIPNCTHVPDGSPSRDSANVPRPSDPAAFDLDPLPSEVQGNEDATPLLAIDASATDVQIDFFDSDYVEGRRKAIQAYYDAQPAKART